MKKTNGISAITPLDKRVSVAERAPIEAMIT